MASEEHLALLRQAVNAWNAWRRQHPYVVPTLREAGLSDARLHRANLAGADLLAADLRRAYLVEARLARADLRAARLGGADLRGAELHEADLGGADLTGADLRGADLRGAIVRGAQVGGADLSGAYLLETVLAGIDLSGARGLDTCRHLGPSVLDHRTLQCSGSLPVRFLRGCGLPDAMIECLPPLRHQPIQVSPCLISYASRDGDLAGRLHADLQDRGVRCWLVPEDLKTGDRLGDTIGQAVGHRAKRLLVLSESAIASPWVEAEVATALAEEHTSPERGAVLFTVRIDGAVLDTERAWARQLRRERPIGDFTAWRDREAYRRSFERLLRDLMPELERRPGQGT